MIAGFSNFEIKIAPNKRILALILIIKLLVISSATRERHRIVTEESVVLLEIGERIPGKRFALVDVVYLPVRPFGWRIEQALHFRTWDNTTITQVLITDPRELPITPGVRIERVIHGLEFQDVLIRTNCLLV